MRAKIRTHHPYSSRYYE